MKRIVLVLVLLVTWSLASVPSLTSSALAGDIQIPDMTKPTTSGYGVVETTGAPDSDRNEGDPDGMGDGYGATGSPRASLDSSDSDMCGWSVLEEYYIFLMLIVQQLAP
jgi:hypothetical protein